MQEYNSAAHSERLKITEIFLSLQGETRSSGWPTVFVRLTGCPLRCSWCDTAYAFSGGEWMSQQDILAAVKQHSVKHVTVTGGEPLAQEGCVELLASLADAGYEVSLETSGAIDVSKVDARVIKIVDLKAPGSGEDSKNLWSNLEHLQTHDQVKFVINDRADYDWATEVMNKHQLNQKCEVLYSPVADHMNQTQLADWIVADAAPVRFQIQLHKHLWGDSPGR